MTDGPAEREREIRDRILATCPTKWRRELAAEAVDELLSALASWRARATEAEAAAYEQAAKWCEERASAIAARSRKRGHPRSDNADWVQGCADTIRHNARRALAATRTS